MADRLVIASRRDRPDSRRFLQFPGDFDSRRLHHDPAGKQPDRPRTKSLVLIWSGTILAALPGCSAPDQGSEGLYRLGPGFSVEEEGHITSAMTRWSEWSGRPPALTSDAVCTIERGAISDPQWIGFYWMASKRSELDADDLQTTCGGDARCWERTVLHELGHSNGLDHLPGGQPDIMSRSLSPTTSRTRTAPSVDASGRAQTTEALVSRSDGRDGPQQRANAAPQVTRTSKTGLGSKGPSPSSFQTSIGG